MSQQLNKATVRMRIYYKTVFCLSRYMFRLRRVIIRPYINTENKKYIEQVNSCHYLGNVSYEKEVDIDNKLNNY
jgi:hypothetical protein